MSDEPAKPVPRQARNGIPCKVCTHLEAEEIAKRLSEPHSERGIAQEFGISRASLRRHKAHSVPKVVVVLTGERDLDEISRLEAATREILRKTKVDKVKLDAIARLQSLANERTRLHQERAGTASLTSDPAYQQIVATMVGTICADCRSAVNAALRKLIGTSLDATAGGGDTRVGNEGAPGAG